VSLGPGQKHWLQPNDVFRIGSLEFQVLRFNVGLCAEKGVRAEMQSTEVALQDLAVSHWRHSSLFAVFDGHGGHQCAAYLKQNLHVNLVDTVVAKGNLDESPQVLHDMYDSFIDAFLDSDRRWCAQVRERRQFAEAGSTAVLVCMLGDQVWCANCGDSRAVLCREGSALQLSADHKPTRPDEFARIQAAGGFVTGGRVMGRLAVSRAIGDVDCKGTLEEGAHPLIKVEPEIRHFRLAPEDEFMVLACDGLWDVFDSQEAVDFARNHLASMPPGDQDPEETARAMVRCAIDEKKSKDNCSVMIVTFKREVVLEGSDPR